MPHQVAITLRAPIVAGHEPDVATLLEMMRTQGAAHNDIVPFADVPGVHFARLFVLDAMGDLDGRLLPACLYYMADVDDVAERHLRALVTLLPEGLDELFGHCEGYPTPATVSRRVEWLRGRQVAPAATYIHAVGRSVDQVRQEARLHDHVDDVVDHQPGAEYAQLTAVEAHSRIRSLVFGRDDLRWVRWRPRGPGLAFRIRDTAHLVALPLVTLVLLPVLIPLVIVMLLLIRLAERRDVPDVGPAAPEQVRALERLEDHIAQNPFTAVGFVKAGRVRRLTMRGVLLGLDYADRHVYRRDNLAGVRTIHFARWVPVDDGRRLIFASSYDGTLESYMDEFIDQLAPGLNAVFSNGLGYPATRWLLFGGAKDEVAFKNYLRRRQVPTPVFYSAYEGLPARNIDTNAALRADLPRSLDEQEAEAWCALV